MSRRKQANPKSLKGNKKHFVLFRKLNKNNNN